MAVTWAFRCLLWSFVSASATAYVISYYLLGDASWQLKTAAGIFAVLGTLSTLVAFHISTLRCSETHTARTLLLQYIFFQGAHLIVSIIFSRLTKQCNIPREPQEAFLRKLIFRDADTEYGRRYLKGIKSLQDFREKHPLTKYEHYRDYFQRLADGEKNVCVAGKLDRFGVSSGTTGKGKLIPVVFKEIDFLVMFAIPKVLKRSSPVQRAALLYCKPSQKFTKSGLPIAPTMFLTQKSAAVLSAIQNAPTSAFQISTDFEATYIHLLFALTDRNIFTFFAPFTSQLYRAFTMLEDKQDMFLEDLTTGRVNPGLNIDEETRRSLDAALKPNPARAEELRGEFARGFVGIVGRIWPHMKCITGADISGYMKKLEARYTKGILLYTAFYGCTEGLIAANLWLDGRPQQYVPVLGEILVEFIPEDLSEEENPKTLLIDEIEVGKRYEIAITATSGFYRYRMGDVIEVVGLYQKCPVIQIRYRTGELLNLRSEKIDKLVVDRAIQESLSGWTGASLVEWTCAESPLMYGDQEVAKYDMFYILFVELESKTDLRLSPEQKSLFDESLRKQHEYYDHYRKVGTICEARVMVVRPGSFQKLRELIIANSTASYNLFKMPKKLRTKATLDLMMQNAVNPDVQT